MFRKIKIVLFALVFGSTVASCSSDDSGTTVVLEGAEYFITVTVTEDATINKVMGVVYEGENMENDIIEHLTTTEWSKIYRKKETQKISFTAQGIGRSKDSKMNIKVTLDGVVVDEAFASGEQLNSTIVIAADKEKKK